ncbi:hypothetical protein [Kutzneria kofuensis]|uniref:Uncharacterized protein n=1 Tax=Kutzneria kofuensis TaxID=103725 RepID=A0A7W9KIK2_9PSEU|nr:hypothetical protein [Kutzneria kofuensis]MBB5892938.1 hypothetical protein [Kutzneria kofuensis]
MHSQRVPVLCPDHLPDGLCRMVAQIVDDITVALPTVHPKLRVEVGDPAGRPLLTFTVWFDHVRRTAFGVPVRMLRASVEQLRGDLAAKLQNAFVEEYGKPLPPCPGHEHSLAPEVRDVAVWLCPYDPGHWSCRIGDYRAEG